MENSEIKKRLKAQADKGDHNAKVLLAYYEIPKSTRLALRELAILRFKARNK